MDNWFKFVQVIAVPVVCGLVLWMWKLDDRQVDFITEYATKEDLRRVNQASSENVQQLRKEITEWLKRVELKLDRIVERELDGEQRK